MALSFNLQEYILFRTEIKRELTNTEVDTNFKMVSNPWVATRIYEIGNIVYHPVIVDDPATTGDDQVLAWWRSNIRTTQGVFDTSQWDMIGGIGSGNINIQGANSFGKIKVNSSAATGSLSAGNDAILTSANPNDTFNLIAGAGMQLQYNVANKVIKLVNTLATNPGEINAGLNLGLGVGHQDVYAGKVGLNLEFNGFQATNTTNAAGNALSISTNAIQNNIEYNFNEANVDLSKLNSGLPLISMLSDVASNAPANGDIFQYSVANLAWGPVPISALGANNIYGINGIITDPDRDVLLNASAGNLQFNRNGTANTGVHISNLASTHQIQLRNTSATGNAATQYALNNIAVATAGIYGTDGSFGINMGATGLAGLTVDALSISTNGELYVPQIAVDTLLTAGEGFRIPLVEFTGGTAVGKFASTAKYFAGIYTAQDGTAGQVQLEHEGRINLQSKNDTTNASPFVSLNVSSYQDFSGVLTDGFGIQAPYFSGGGSLLGAAYLNWMDKTDLRYIGEHFSTSANFDGTVTGVNATKIIGSNISLDNKTTSNLAINVGELISFTGTGVNPQRVGVYSNVVSDYTGIGSQNGELVLAELIADSGTWAGYFVGCVNIDQGGLVLPSSAVAPVCNGVSGGSVADRTLWINSANGHLMRGYVDVETSSGGGAIELDDLTDVATFPSPIPDDSLLVYNLSNNKWEAATLAAYNLDAVALTNGGASIQLSDGTASSDVDLLAGSGISLAVNAVTDEITITATGGSGAQGFQGTAGAQGNTGGAQGNNGANGAQGAGGGNGAQGNNGSNGAQGAGGGTGAQGNTGGAQGASGPQGSQGPSSITQNFTITVANPGAGNRFYIDAILTPDLTLLRGFTYTFNQTDGSNSTHPLQLSATSGGPTQYTSGWSDNGGTAGSTLISTFKVPQDAPDPLYYFCINHANMGGTSKINIAALATGAQGFQGFQGPNPIANSTANTLAVVDIANVMGNYCNMASANANTTYTFTNATLILGGFGRVLINTATQPTVTGATLIKGDSWILNTNMYMTIQYNGNRTEYWFEQIAL